MRSCLSRAHSARSFNAAIVAQATEGYPECGAGVVTRRWRWRWCRWPSFEADVRLLHQLLVDLRLGLDAAPDLLRRPVDRLEREGVEAGAQFRVGEHLGHRLADLRLHRGCDALRRDKHDEGVDVEARGPAG